MTMVPQLGSMVIYRLTADDAEAINPRRTTGEKIAKRVAIGYLAVTRS